MLCHGTEETSCAQGFSSALIPLHPYLICISSQGFSCVWSQKMCYYHARGAIGSFTLNRGRLQPMAFSFDSLCDGNCIVIGSRGVERRQIVQIVAVHWSLYRFVWLMQPSNVLLCRHFARGVQSCRLAPKLARHIWAHLAFSSSELLFFARLRVALKPILCGIQSSQLCAELLLMHLMPP